MKNNFIEVYENAIPDELCDVLMELFNKYPNLTHQGASMQGVNKEIKSSTDFNVVRLEDERVRNDIMRNLLGSSLTNSVELYNIKYPLWLHGSRYKDNLSGDELKDTLLYKYTPDMRTILLKRYFKGVDGYHAWHEDNGPKDNRVLVCMFYLNDVEEGGETEFYFQQVKLKPTKGSLVIFPAYFTHLHRGNIPMSNDKYICNIWIEKTR